MASRRGHRLCSAGRAVRVSFAVGLSKELCASYLVTACQPRGHSRVRRVGAGGNRPMESRSWTGAIVFAPIPLWLPVRTVFCIHPLCLRPIVNSFLRSPVGLNIDGCWAPRAGSRSLGRFCLRVRLCWCRYLSYGVAKPSRRTSPVWRSHGACESAMIRHSMNSRG